MSKRLEGKTAVVTGGGSGIGLAIAESFATEGCKVIIAGRDEKKLKDAAAAFKGSPALLTHAVDVADRAGVTKMFTAAKKELGRIDILVVSAGVNTPKRSMAEMDPDDWDRIVTITSSGAYNCFREVLPEMVERGDGLIINVSSIAGKRALNLAGIAYCAGKFAQTALGTAVGLEVGEKGVRVTNIYPGECNTPLLKERPKPVTEVHKARILQPQDVADAALMVACLPPRAHVAELLIKPAWQNYA
jgi:NADP-dependent 3-hydroxy acid dehydrogenase YdfG